MSRKSVRGVSMITAIFLLVVIAVLGAYIASVATTQHTTAALDLQGSKAYHAAYAGMQWGVFQALQNTSCVISPGVSIALTGNLSGFSATIVCASTAYTEGSSNKTIYRITSTGCSPPNAGACPGVQGGYYVERQLEATVDK